MRQAKIFAPHDIRYTEEPVIPPKADEVQIRVERIGICGSDIHVWHGVHPFTPFPVLQGHEFMGTVAAVGTAVANPPAIGSKATALPQIVCGKCNPCRKGRYNICENLKVRGFQAEGCGRDFYNIPAERLIPLPADMTPEQGAFVEPASVAVHACHRAGDLTGRNVVVLGAGTIGNLVAQVAKARGARKVLITDIADHRLDVARQVGVDLAVDSRTTSLGDAKRQLFGDEGFDLAFECAGAEPALAAAVAEIDKGGTILVVGVHSKPPVVDMAAVGEHEVMLTGSMMYWRDDWIEAVELLSRTIKVEPLISRHFPFEQWPDAYRFIDANGANIVKVMVDVA